MKSVAERQEGILPVSSNEVISRDVTVPNLFLGQNLTIAGIC